MFSFKNFVIIEVLLILLYYFGYLFFQLYANCTPHPAPVFNPRYAYQSLFHLIFPCPATKNAPLLKMAAFWSALIYGAIFLTVRVIRHFMYGDKY